MAADAVAFHDWMTDARVMAKLHRIPWTEPAASGAPDIELGQILALTRGDPWSHVVAICAASRDAEWPAISHFDRRRGAFEDGPLAGLEASTVLDGTRLPALLDSDRNLVCDDPPAVAESLAPEFFQPGAQTRAVELRASLVDAVYRLGELTDQAEYESAHEELGRVVAALDVELSKRRFLGGRAPNIVDVLLFTFAVRLNPVYYELHKASIGLLADFPSLEGHARDLYERPAFHTTTDFDAIKAYHYLDAPVVNPKKVVPAGGIPDLDAPHFRHELGEVDDGVDGAVEEDRDAEHTPGEWVRGQSNERDWIRPDPDAKYPAERGRYHLYAPYNCPWSHRALLGRAVKGLEDIVGASIVYFRRDPDHGWQFNPSIPGCTEDRANDVDYVEELYHSVGSDERSVPVLWDTETDTIVSNESADILRMFNSAFGDLADGDLDLYPEPYRAEIDRLNRAVYQRINNGAYKAGFADGQFAYERAFARYFRALDWIEDLLGDRRWLAGSPDPTEADVRLFPTLFRHDAVYYARFKLNLRRISDYPELSRWLGDTLNVEGVARASNLDHARNGYFGRTGNEIVPAGPVPLGLSPADFSRDVWLNRE